MPSSYTRKLISNLEEASEFVLSGWALYQANPSITISLDVFINDRFAARIPAGTFRSDLAAEGFGNGYHAFYFNPFDFLSKRTNSVEVREASSGQQIGHGHRMVTTVSAANRKVYQESVVRAQSRWKQPVVCSRATGEQAFLRRLQPAAHFHSGLRILEIGAGQGGLIRQILKRRNPFRSYLGLDLSRVSVESLHARFASSRIRFLHADATRYPYNTGFDLVIASSVCETMFPSFVALITNISRVLTAGSLFVFDLAVEDDRASISRAEWKGNGYLRLYSQAEIRRQLAQGGMEMLTAEIYERTPREHRVFVTAVKIWVPGSHF